MKTIWRFPFTATEGAFALDMPQNACILAVQNTGGHDLSVWALVDTEAENETRHFRLFRTNQLFDLGWPIISVHIGTVQMHRDAFVFHLFEITGDLR